MTAPAFLSGVLDLLGVVVVTFFVLLHTAAAAVLVSAVRELWCHWDLADESALAPVLMSEALPTVSVIVTGRADLASTIDGLHGLLSLRYPRHEVVLVHDGGMNGFLRTLVERFDLYQVPPAVLVNVPTEAVRGYYRSRRHGKLFVIDKAHAGHADDLNAALNASRFPYVLTTDINTTLDPDALSRMMRPFLLGERVAAVSGPTRVGLVGAAGAEAGVPVGWLGGVQAVERLRESTFARLGWNLVGGWLPDRTSVQLHRREHLLELDGYRAGVTDPERDLVVRLRAHLRDQRATAVPAVPDPVAWAPSVPTLGFVARRRSTAQRARVEELLARRASGVRGAERSLERWTSVAHVVLALAPLLELLGYLLLAAALTRGGVRHPFVPLFLLAVPGYAMLLSFWAVALEVVGARTLHAPRDVVRLCGMAVLEQLGYRQVIMWARLRGIGGALTGRRRGEADRPATIAAAADMHAAGDEARAR
jgi:cellulose synthase/poly-beta-1,6-N-acetylglucosamine synthase-like glycosyltransferase